MTNMRDRAPGLLLDDPGRGVRRADDAAGAIHTTKFADYWLWAKNGGYRNRIPFDIVDTTRFESKRAAQQANLGGSILDADPPTQGVKIARRMTLRRRPARLDLERRSSTRCLARW
jgi:hypothetical protein